jgi:putative ABC transport system substrate-binding protein
MEQFPNADPISWANAIRKFMGLNADLIVTYGAPAALAAFKEGAAIPVVFADVYGPVEIGIATNLTRPAANLTGISSKVPLVTLLKMMQDIVPVRHLGVIYSSREAGSLVQLKELRRVSAQLGISLEEYNVMTQAGFDAGLSALLPKVDGLLVTECTVASRNFERIIRKATDAKVPVLTMIPDSASHGALISLEVSTAEQGQIAAEQAARILGGVKADTVPIATPKKIELLINMKAARILDLQVPFSVLSNATKIIK